MCWILAILCGRDPLKELVMAKLKQKLPELTVEYSLPFLMLLNALGADAITEIFVENIEFFLSKLNIEESAGKYSLNNGCGAIPHQNKPSCSWQLYGYAIMVMI